MLPIERLAVVVLAAVAVSGFVLGLICYCGALRGLCGRRRLRPMLVAAAVTLVQLMIAPRFDPPARFDHPNPNAVVQWKSADEVHALCHGGAACAFPFKWRPHAGKGVVSAALHYCRLSWLGLGRCAGAAARDCALQRLAGQSSRLGLDGCAVLCTLCVHERFGCTRPHLACSHEARDVPG